MGGVVSAVAVLPTYPHQPYMPRHHGCNSTACCRTGMEGHYCGYLNLLEPVPEMPEEMMLLLRTLKRKPAKPLEAGMGKKRCTRRTNVEQ